MERTDASDSTSGSSSLARSLGAALAARGWTVGVPGIGTGSATHPPIDLMVSRAHTAEGPVDPGPALALLDDGPSRAHGPAEPLGDRQRLRPAILESLGWRLQRIWTADWAHNPDGELARLIQRLEADR